MPINNKTIQIRLTSTEKEEIVKRMHADGYHNLSLWIRMKLLKCPCSAKAKVEEIFRYIAEREEEGGSIRNEEFSDSIDVSVEKESSEIEEKKEALSP
jgi:hypothetical protein